MFIVMDANNNAVTGDTLEEAFKSYNDEIMNDNAFDALTFFEATELLVEQKVVQVKQLAVLKTSKGK